MKRLSFVVTASLLLMPATTLAAYSSPTDLLTATQDTSVPRSFSVTAHAKTNGSYISIWASGTEQGMEPSSMKMSTKATVDIVKGNMKIRVRAEIRVTGGMLYARLVSFDGSYANAFASVSGVLKQSQWIAVPLDASLMQDFTGTQLYNVTNANPVMAENMFHMQSSPGKNGGTVYTLSLTQDYAVTLAQLIREVLQDESPSTDDFFPWRQLAEGMRFESTVFTDSNDAFVSSSFSLSTSSLTSSLSVSGSEQRLGYTPVVQTPDNVVTMDEAIASFSDLANDVPGYDNYMSLPEDEMMESSLMEDDYMMIETEMSTGDFDSVDAEDDVTDCTDPSLSAMELMMLQRTGSCPIEKASTRHGGW